LRFPVSLASSVAAQVTSETPATDSWYSRGLTYLSKPGEWFQQAMSEFTPWACRTLIRVEVESTARITGSGDGLYQYCTCFAYLGRAAASTVLWTLGSEAWRLGKPPRAPTYDRLHSLFRLVVGFHLMYMMLVYGAAKVWCSQFPPISDGQLETTYGDS